MKTGMEFIKGKFVKQVQKKDNRFWFEYKDSSTGEEKDFHESCRYYY